MYEWRNELVLFVHEEAGRLKMFHSHFTPNILVGYTTANKGFPFCLKQKQSDSTRPDG